MSEPMPWGAGAERDLLVGARAVRLELIDARQFAEACASWSAHQQGSLGDLLVQRGWLSPAQKADLEARLPGAAVVTVGYRPPESADPPAAPASERAETT